METKKDINHFGCKSKISKDLKISLSSFLYIKSLKVTTVTFIDYYGNYEYKYYDRKWFIRYYENLIKELEGSSKKETATSQRRLFLANRGLKYLENSSEKDRIKNIKKIYEDEKKDISFKDYIKKHDDEMWQTIDDYDFNSSFVGDTYSINYIKRMVEYLKYNYEMNMRHFNNLSKEEFDRCLNRFIKYHHKFKQVFDINEYMYATGYYVLVLDEYKQVYIGVSDCIGERIKEHWRRIMPIDRKIYGDYRKSKISIDDFGPLDTTRIYIAVDENATDEEFSKEDTYIDCFPNEFITNRIRGGKKYFLNLRDIKYRDSKN